MVAVTADAELCLAASVLAAYGTVRRQLEDQAPKLGRVEQQAKDAFGHVEKRWVRMAAGDLADECDEGRAAGIAEAMGAVVNAEAAKGLAVGMDVQLAKGWAPEVAWQRALAGYGLSEKAMRGYLAGVMAIKTEVAKAVVPERAAIAVQRALDTHARRVAADGMVVVAKFGRSPIKVAGIAVRALDTGRVLMLQRALDPKDPAGGMWEFPGGHLEKGEQPFDGAKREWQEEVGRRLSPALSCHGTWTNGIYQGFVVDLDHEADLPIHRGRGAYVNPDDPDGDAVEQVAWWSVDQFARNPAIRPELRAALPDVRRALDTVSKAFDEHQARDRTGRWTTGPAAGRKAAAPAPTLERPVAEELPPVAEEKPNPYLAAQQDARAKASPYLQGGNPYQGALAGNPYSLAGNPYEAAQSANPYQATPNPYEAAAAQGPNPYLFNPYQQQRPTRGRKKLNRTLLVLTPDPSEPPPPPPPPRPPGGGFFLAHEDLSDYYGRGEGVNNAVDFTGIRNFYEDRGNPLHSIPLQFASSALAAAPRLDVDDQSWDLLLPLAQDLSEEVDADPMWAAQQLDKMEVQEVGQIAGYPLSSPDAILDEIQAATESDSTERQEGLLHALTDFIVWRNPEVMQSTAGEAMAGQMRALDLTDTFAEPPPSVMSFPYGLNPGEDSADMTGQYRSRDVIYRSALAEHGSGTPPGLIGVREVIVEPEWQRKGRRV